MISHKCHKVLTSYNYNSLCTTPLASFFFFSKIWLPILLLSFRCSSLNLSKVLEALNQRMLEPVTEVQLVSNVINRTMCLMHDYVSRSCFAINPAGWGCRIWSVNSQSSANQMNSHWKYTKVLAGWRITIVHKQGVVVTFSDCYIAFVRPIEKRI